MLLRFISFYFIGWILLVSVAVKAQAPFTCNGRMFRVIEGKGGSIFEELFIDEAGRIRFEERNVFFGERLNGIAFHPRKKLIYGVQLGKQYRLCRIDGNYQLESLTTLPLPTDMLFVSGDVSPDERYLVLLGYSPDETTNLLALVDLTDPQFRTELFPLQTSDPEQRIIYCADIAFHPTDNRLYGFDHLGERLVRIDIENRLIDNTTYPTSKVLQGNVPSIFFDAFGRLYGIGAPFKGLATNRRLYQFNLENGAVSELSKLSFEGNQDACSCPYQVKLLKRVSSRSAAPCTRLKFEFVMINRTDFVQEDVSFRDTFPEKFRITQIDKVPLGGTLVAGEGSSVLAIDHMILPVGTDTFTVEVELDPDLLGGWYQNRAHLGPVTLSDPVVKEWVRSDDPDTPQPDDATRFEVSELEIDFSNDPQFLCDGDSLVLDPDVEGALGYRWSTGDDTEVLKIHSPGVYALTVTTPCEETSSRIRIKPSFVQVDLGPDRRIERGTPILLKPKMQPISKEVTYLWLSKLNSELPCKTCESIELAPLDDLTLDLLVTDENGCEATDSIRIETVDFALFAPNAFSPNGDGNNDVFYLQSRLSQKIEQLDVYDRWGNLLFAKKEGQTNQKQAGWDGTYRGQLLNAGVYVWRAVILTPEGKQEAFQGTIQLVR